VPILDVAVQLSPAIALYERRGWTRLGRVTVALSDCTLDEFVYVSPGAA
jgi:hypothetical protein